MLNESEQERFYRLPKEFFEDEFYKNSLDLTSVIIYSLLRDRYELSIKNKNSWIDKNGRVFCFYSREKMQLQLGKSERTIHKAIKQLKSVGLIEERRQGQGKANMIYVHQPRTLKKDYSRTLKNKGLDAEELSPNDNKNNDIKINEKEKSRDFNKSDKGISFSNYKDLISVEELYEYDSILSLIDYFQLLYKHYLNKDHPRLSFEQWEHVISGLLTDLTDEYGGDCEIDVEAESEMMKSYFEVKFNNCNYSLLHYISGDIRKLRYYETGYYF